MTPKLQPDPYAAPPHSVSIAQILTEARTHLIRVTPAEAAAELSPFVSNTGCAASTLLIDIRPAVQRLREGTITYAIPIERNVLEWRLDPRSDARLPAADRYDLRAIVICQEGYTSSLAARELQRLGLYRATDVVGGVRAWREGAVEGFVAGEG